MNGELDEHTVVRIKEEHSSGEDTEIDNVFATDGAAAATTTITTFKATDEHERTTKRKNLLYSAIVLRKIRLSVRQLSKQRQQCNEIENSGKFTGHRTTSVVPVCERNGNGAKPVDRGDFNKIRDTSARNTKRRNRKYRTICE